jgi:hypothetical protein
LKEKKYILFALHTYLLLQLYCHYCGVRFHKQTVTAISYLHDKWLSFNAHPMKMLLFLLVESVYWKRIHCAHSLLLCSHCHQIKFNKQAITSTYPWYDRWINLNMHLMEMVAQTGLCSFVLCFPCFHFLFVVISIELMCHCYERMSNKQLIHQSKSCSICPTLCNYDNDCIKLLMNTLSIASIALSFI